jgi:hypothetical protein
MPNATKSKLALWVSGIYLTFALGSWLLPLIAKPGESLAGVFLILFAQPWASLWVWITDKQQIDIFALTMVFMLVGILVNAWIIYRCFSWVSRR